MSNDESSASRDREIRVLEIIGCFLAFFGLLLLLGIPAGKTVSDRVTNLVSALILLALGGAMFWRGVARHRGAWLLPVVLFAILAAVSCLVALCLSRLASEDDARPPAEAGETQEKEASPESQEPETVEGEETQSRALEQKTPRSFPVKTLRRIGWAMRDAVSRISLEWVKVSVVIGFLAIGAVVWLVRRDKVFEGVGERTWWRDLRLWTVVIVATQIVIYLLLGT
jgi:hypothetical protein